MHNQAKILKRLQIPQEDCKNKDLLFYFKLQEQIRRRARDFDKSRTGAQENRGQTTDESFNGLMVEMQGVQKAPREAHHTHPRESSRYRGRDMRL